MTTGAKAGIAVGVSVGAIAILAVLALLFLRRRKKTPNGDEPKAELDGSADAVAAVPFAPGTPGSVTAPSELDSKAARPWSLRSELDGTEAVSPAAAKRESNLRHSDTVAPDEPRLAHPVGQHKPSPSAELPG